MDVIRPPGAGTIPLRGCSSLEKRPCRTTPGPGYEVGESSAAGAARQVGPTTARADLYGFAERVKVAALGRPGLERLRSGRQQSEIAEFAWQADRRPADNISKDLAMALAEPEAYQRRPLKLRVL
ncbi:hypothetical protein Tco_0670652 [Tanacetum coccineum]